MQLYAYVYVCLLCDKFISSCSVVLYLCCVILYALAYKLLNLRLNQMKPTVIQYLHYTYTYVYKLHV